jgi:hypothetical protein
MSQYINRNTYNIYQGNLFRLLADKTTIDNCSHMFKVDDVIYYIKSLNGTMEHRPRGGYFKEFSKRINVVLIYTWNSNHELAHVDDNDICDKIMNKKSEWTLLLSSNLGVPQKIRYNSETGVRTKTYVFF